MYRFLVLLYYAAASRQPNPLTVLYDRLFGQYRIEFVQTDDSCNRTEWESSTQDVPSVPRHGLEMCQNSFKKPLLLTQSICLQSFKSKCLRYVKDESVLPYTPDVRPVVDNNRTIDINYGIGIIQIKGKFTVFRTVF